MSYITATDLGNRTPFLFSFFCLATSILSVAFFKTAVSVLDCRDTHLGSPLKLEEMVGGQKCRGEAADRISVSNRLIDFCLCVAVCKRFTSAKEKFSPASFSLIFSDREFSNQQIGCQSTKIGTEICFALIKINFWGSQAKTEVCKTCVDSSQHK